MASGCGDVLSLQDLKTAKLHQVFEAEVITGLSGGTPGGANIDFATNPVTGQVQKTMPAVLRDVGFVPASFDFTTGGTLTVNDRNKSVLWPVSSGGDGDYYSWEGALPKVIPAASTPASTGGTGPGAWKAVGGISLRNDLSAADINRGDALISVVQPFNGSKQRTQHQKNADIVSVKDFGAKGDGATDDTEAFNAALASSANTVSVPDGSYLIRPITMPSEKALIGTSASFSGSKLLCNVTTGDLITLGDAKNQIKNIYFDTKPGLVRTSGKYINFNGGTGRHLIEDVEMWNAWDGISITGGSNITVKSPRFFSSKGVCFACNGGYNHSLYDPHADNDANAQPSAGILITEAGDLTIYGAKMLHCGIAFYINASPGKFVNSVVVSQSFFDSSVTAGLITNQGTGNVQRVDFTDTWFGNSQAGLTLLKTGSGEINGITLNNPRFCVITGDGLRVGPGVLNVRELGGQYSLINGSSISVAGQFYMNGGVLGEADGLPGAGTSLFLDSTAAGYLSGVKFGVNNTMVSGTSADFALRDNPGFRTSAIGSTLIPSGTAITVAHTLAVTPRLQDINIYPISGLAGVSEYYVSDVSATTFIIRLNVSPGAGIQFGWKIDSSRLH